MSKRSSVLRARCSILAIRTVPAARCGCNIRLGVAWSGGKLYVADTYNNKIKVIDIDQHTCQTVAGTGKSGNADADNGAAATFSEPGGFSAAAGRLFVADTNNHLIRVVDLTAPFSVTTLQIHGLTAPSARP